MLDRGDGTLGLVLVSNGGESDFFGKLSRRLEILLRGGG